MVAQLSTTACMDTKHQKPAKGTPVVIEQLAHVCE